MSEKIGYQNLPTNEIQNSDDTIEDEDGDLSRFFKRSKQKIFSYPFKLCLVVIDQF